MIQLGAIDATNLGLSAILKWSVWAGASIMVSSSLVMFALQWKTVVRAFGGRGEVAHRRGLQAD